MHDEYDREVCPTLTRADTNRRGHDLKLYKERAKTKIRQYSYTIEDSGCVEQLAHTRGTGT